MPHGIGGIAAVGEEAEPRIDGPTGGKSRNEGSYLGGSLSPAITPGSGAARKKSGLGAIGTAAVCPCGTYLLCRGA